MHIKIGNPLEKVAKLVLDNERLRAEKRLLEEKVKALEAQLSECREREAKRGT